MVKERKGNVMNKKQKLYKIDLRKLDPASKGEFPCPRCGVIISPDDETEEVYTIAETSTKKGMLEKLLLVCKKCGSKIELVGFLYNPPSKGRLRKKYQKLIPLYGQLAEEVKFILGYHLKQVGVKVHNIESRIKNFESFYEKIIRKEVEKDPFTVINDIAGVRIICLYRTDLDRIRDLINREFNVLHSDTSRTRSEDHFGYMSDHYVVTLSKKYKGARYDKIKNLKCEIQVRTILMHAWASVSHHLDYKKEVDIPSHLLKDFKALSGLFYVADTHFEMLRKIIEETRSDSMKAAKKAKFDLNQEMNLDSLRAYLAWKFPKRKAHPVDSAILDFLREEGFEKLTEIDKAVDRSKPMLEKIESKQPKKYHLHRIGALTFSIIYSKKVETERTQKPKNQTQPARKIPK